MFSYATKLFDTTISRVRSNRCLSQLNYERLDEAWEPRDGDPLRNLREPGIKTDKSKRVEVDSGIDAIRKDIDKKENLARKNIWKDRDDEFSKVYTSAIKTYYTNRAINIILVIVGIFLIGYGLTYHWYFSASDISKGTATDNDVGTNSTKEESSQNQQTDPVDLTGILSGGGGLATLITLLFYKSQKYIQKSLTNLAITDMLYKSHYLSFESIADYDYMNLKYAKNDRVRSFDNLKEMNELLMKITTSYVSTLLKSSKMEDEDKGESK